MPYSRCSPRKRDRFVRIDAFLPVVSISGRKVGRACLAHLREIKQHAAAFGRNDFQGSIHLLVAMAGHGSEHIPGQTLRVDAHEHVFAVADVALDQREVRFVSEDALEADHPEVAVPRARGCARRPCGRSFPFSAGSESDRPP